MSELDRATEKARARDAARKNGNSETALATRDEATIAGFSAVDAFKHPAQVALAKVASGEWSAAPQIMKLEKGVTIVGVLEGAGPPAEVIDPMTREIKELDTWILHGIENPNLRISILSSAQLDRKLPPHVGGQVSITRLDEHDSASGRRYTDYFVAGEEAAAKKAAATSGS